MDLIGYPPAVRPVAPPLLLHEYRENRSRGLASITHSKACRMVYGTLISNYTKHLAFVAFSV